MNKFKELIQGADTSETGETFYCDVQVMNNGEYFIDPRTERNADGIFIVKPFCYYNGHYWYVCPDCEDIHFSENIGKMQTGCCLDIDCTRHQFKNDKHYFIQRDPMILDDLEP